MPLKIGAVLKLPTPSLGVLYFEVTEINVSGIRLKYLCRMEGEQVYFEKKSHSQIYKSELGKHYFEVDITEMTDLRKRVLREIYRLFVLLKYFL